MFLPTIAKTYFLIICKISFLNYVQNTTLSIDQKSALRIALLVTLFRTLMLIVVWDCFGDMYTKIHLYLYQIKS